MNTVSLPFPELLAIAGTRWLLGIGIWLLISEHLTHQQRQTAGWTLFAIGALSTVAVITLLTDGTSAASTTPSCTTCCLPRVLALTSTGRLMTWKTTTPLNSSTPAQAIIFPNGVSPKPIPANSSSIPIGLPKL